MHHRQWLFAKFACNRRAPIAQDFGRDARAIVDRKTCARCACRRRERVLIAHWFKNKIASALTNNEHRSKQS